MLPFLWFLALHKLLDWVSYFNFFQNSGFSTSGDMGSNRSEMKQRITELLTTLEKVKRNAELRQQEQEELIGDLKRANSYVLLLHIAMKDQPWKTLPQSFIEFSITFEAKFFDDCMHLIFLRNHKFKYKFWVKKFAKGTFHRKSSIGLDKLSDGSMKLLLEQFRRNV